MISVSVEADIREAVRMLNLLPEEADRAASKAINKLADTAKGRAARIISQAAKLPLQKVRKRISIRRSSSKRLIAIVTGKSYSPNMGNYSPSQGAVGTGAVVPPGRPAFKAHAFILKRKSSPVMIRKRIGAKRVGRKPLESIRVEVLKRTWVQGTVNDQLKRTISERWPLEFDRALKMEVRSLRGSSVKITSSPLLPSLTGPLFE